MNRPTRRTALLGGASSAILAGAPVANLLAQETKPLPRLPLQPGAKVVGFGHSFIQFGANAIMPGMMGEERNARGVLNQVAMLDQRFNLDIFATPDNPGFTGTNALSGAHQGIGGGHLMSTPHALGTLERTPYVLARYPQIVYLDIGTNDITSGVGGSYGTNRNAAAVIAALDTQINRLTEAGVFVVIQTVAFRFDWPQTDMDSPKSRFTILNQVNDWIKAQAGRPGIQVCDTTAIDGTQTADRELFGPDGIHPAPILARKRAETLLPILRAMVSPYPSSHSSTIDNRFPHAGFPGANDITGEDGRITGKVANGLRIAMHTGASTAVATKQPSDRGGEWQVLTVTAENDGTPLHEIRLTMRDLTLNQLGVVDGDWLECHLPFELDGWAGWRTADPRGQGTLSFNNELYAGPTLAYASNDKSGFTDTKGTQGVLSTKLMIKPGLAISSLRYSIRPIQIRFLSTAPGHGTIKIGAPILRKIADPRKVWMLS